MSPLCGASQIAWVYICPQATKSMYHLSGMRPAGSLPQSKCGHHFQQRRPACRKGRRQHRGGPCPPAGDIRPAPQLLHLLDLLKVCPQNPGAHMQQVCRVLPLSATPCALGGRGSMRQQAHETLGWWLAEQDGSCQRMPMQGGPPWGLFAAQRVCTVAA
jgi:hypothetical protein